MSTTEWRPFKCKWVTAFVTRISRGCVAILLDKTKYDHESIARDNCSVVDPCLSGRFFGTIDYELLWCTSPNASIITINNCLIIGQNRVICFYFIQVESYFSVVFYFVLPGRRSKKLCLDTHSKGFYICFIHVYLWETWPSGYPWHDLD